MPKSVLTRKRSWIARFAVLAIVFSLLAVALPASAHSVALGTSTSCPPTTPSAGFTDIGGFDATTQLAINCLVAFGISTGTSATTFSPNEPVTRWQMALFLIRQAADHGLTIPAAVSQGYTDIGGFDTATQNAINQITQLGISKGTSTTTFSPNDPVTRWQMALFIYRTGVAAGVTFNNNTSHNEFTDIGSLLAEAQTAINALADTRADPEGHIALGTGGSSFSPLLNVVRWQMALFLTRLLAADNVPAPAGQQVTVTPTDDVTLASGNARAFTATFKNADGTPYTGFVFLWILDVNASNAAIIGDAAENVDFQAGSLSDALPGGGPTTAGFAGTDGVVTGLIRHDGVAAEKVRVYAIRDANANGVSDAGEANGTGGLTTFSAAPAVEAVSGVYLGMDVVSTSASGDSFVAGDAAVNCGNGVGVNCTFFYDSGDLFQNGGAVMMDAFEAALNALDVLDITYDADPADQSTFVITTDNDPALTVTDPAAGGVTVDAASYLVKGTAVAGYTVAIYFDGNNNAVRDAGEAKLAEGTAAGDGTWSLNVPLVQEFVNNLVATQRSAPAADDLGTGTDVPPITETAAAAATLAAPITYTNGGIAGVLDGGDVLTLDFNETLQAPTGGDTMQVTDGTDTVTLTNGGNATFAFGGDNSIILVTINGPLGVTINGASAAQNLSGWVGTDGLAININTDPDRAFTVA